MAPTGPVAKMLAAHSVVMKVGGGSVGGGGWVGWWMGGGGGVWFVSSLALAETELLPSMGLRYWYLYVYLSL